MPGISTAPPEYYYYSLEYFTPLGGVSSPVLSASQVANITNNEYSYYGLNNTYNAKALYYYYSITEKSTTTVPDHLSFVLTQFGISDLPSLYAFMDTMAG
jgi:hypothetical protein